MELLWVPPWASLTIAFKLRTERTFTGLIIDALGLTMIASFAKGNRARNSHRDKIKQFPMLSADVARLCRPGLRLRP